jgi:hypothetical protein
MDRARRRRAGPFEECSSGWKRLSTMVAMRGNAAAHARVTRGLLACVIIAGSLALWTVVPIAWLSLTRDLAPGGRFVLVILGLPLTMALVFALLSWVDSYRRRLSAVSEPSSGARASNGDSERGERPSLLEVMLVVSAITALVGLIVWWAFIADAADPSGPLQPI